MRRQSALRKLGKHAKKFVPIYFIHFYIIRKKNALETIRKVSCSIIYFLMFARVSFNVVFPVVSVSLSGVLYVTGRRRRL